jgi:hypothetical protein
MKFLQKRWVAVSLCVLMILAGFAVGQAKQQPVSYVPEDWVLTMENSSFSGWYTELQTILTNVVNHFGTVVGGIVVFVLILLLLIVLAVSSALSRLRRRVNRRRK